MKKRKIVAMVLAVLLVVGLGGAAFGAPEPQGEVPEVELKEGEVPEVELKEGEVPEVELKEGEVLEVELKEGEAPEIELKEGEILVKEEEFDTYFGVRGYSTNAGIDIDKEFAKYFPEEGVYEGTSKIDTVYHGANGAPQVKGSFEDVPVRVVRLKNRWTIDTSLENGIPLRMLLYYTRKGNKPTDPPVSNGTVTRSVIVTGDVDHPLVYVYRFSDGNIAQYRKGELGWDDKTGVWIELRYIPGALDENRYLIKINADARLLDTPNFDENGVLIGEYQWGRNNAGYEKMDAYGDNFQLTGEKVVEPPLVDPMDGMAMLSGVGMSDRGQYGVAVAANVSSDGTEITISAVVRNKETGEVAVLREENAFRVYVGMKDGVITYLSFIGTAKTPNGTAERYSICLKSLAVLNEQPVG